MESGVVFLVFRALLLFISFCGLNALAQRYLRLERFIAPCFVSCSIIAVLMISGMLRILPVGFGLLYFGGFIGAVDSLVRRLRGNGADCAAPVLLAVICVYLVWRCFPSFLYHSDDFHHWALAARQMLIDDAFPNAADKIVRFQSYPLGSATFIYYVARTLANHEGIYSIAQHFLGACALLPMLSLIQNNRKYLYPVFAVGCVFLITGSKHFITLQVDWLLAYVTIGGIASAVFYRHDIKKAVLTAFPCAIALVYLKNSGMFFSLCILIVLLYLARRAGVSRRRFIGMLAGIGAAILVANFMWSAHTGIAYPDAGSSKHAVSVSAYVESTFSKGWPVIAQIARMMVQNLLHPNLRVGLSMGILVALSGAAALGCFAIEGQRRHVRVLLQGTLFSFGVFGVWYLMLFFMYVFSMPTSEAIHLASIARYQSTALTLIVGLGLIMFFAFYGREGIRLPRLLSIGYCAVCATAAVGAIGLMIAVPDANLGGKLLSRETEMSFERAAMQTAMETLEIEPEGKVLIYVHDQGKAMPLNTVHHIAVYEFQTPDINILFRKPDPDSGIVPDVPFPEEYSDFNYCYKPNGGGGRFTNEPIDFIAAEIDSADALVILHQDELVESSLETFLADYAGDTPVFYAY